MPNDHRTPWDKVWDAQAMEAELYQSGKRAGGVAATAEWPGISRDRPNILSKALRATQDLFGRQVAARNGGYYNGWVDGYMRRCRDLEHRQQR